MAKELAKMKAAEGRIRRRVELSKELVKKMGMSPEAYVRVAVNAFVMNPSLVDCTHDSVDKAILRCVEIGLVPDGKHASMVPFKNKGKLEAQLLVMVDGKATLARRATKGLGLRVALVYEGEHFVHEEGLNPILEHKPDPTVSHNAADLVAVYAVADMPGGAKEFKVLYRPEVMRAKSFSRGGQLWGKFEHEAWEKTALHRLLKRLPTVADAPPDFDEVQPEPEEPRIMGGGGHFDNTGLQGSQTYTDDPDKVPQPSAEPEHAQGNVQDADQGQPGASDVFDGATDGSPF